MTMELWIGGTGVFLRSRYCSVNLAIWLTSSNRLHDKLRSVRLTVAKETYNACRKIHHRDSMTNISIVLLTFIHCWSWKHFKVESVLVFPNLQIFFLFLLVFVLHYCFHNSRWNHRFVFSCLSRSRFFPSNYKIKAERDIHAIYDRAVRTPTMTTMMTITVTMTKSMTTTSGHHHCDRQNAICTNIVHLNH